MLLFHGELGDEGPIGDVDVNGMEYQWGLGVLKRHFVRACQLTWKVNLDSGGEREATGVAPSLLGRELSIREFVRRPSLLR